MSDELEAIRTRHNNVEPPEGFFVSLRDGQQAHTDRATLLAHVDRLSAELANAKLAIKVQASAVKTLQAAEDSEINVLRSKAAEAHRAVVTLDSERAMNATLTEEIDRLTAELAKERERRVEVEGEVADLKQTVIAFAGPVAARYALDAGFSNGELHPTHYDLLARCGARMVDFKRGEVSPATLTKETP